MARERDQARQAVETLAEIESVFDRLARWSSENPWIVGGVLGAILLVAAVAGALQALGQRAEARASEAVAEVQRGYFEALGAEPGQVDVPPQEDPEAAREVRRTYAERFLEVAREHAGTTAAVSARLEAADLLEEAGETERARTLWQEASEAAPRGSALRGVALERQAAALEQAGAFAEAARAHEAAAEIEAFPGRHLARAQAARTWLEADDVARALALFDRLQEEAPPGAVPPHIQARLRTAKARR